MRFPAGWRPNPDAAAKFAEQDAVGLLRAKYGDLLESARRDVDLWTPLLQLVPTWTRGTQGIGDCVSWGAEICATLLLAIQHVKGVSTWIAEAATEPIYGGARVEAQGGRLGGYQDGTWGSAAAEWLRDWGVLLRISYGDVDLSTYSARRAKDWGNFGCGGQHDKGKLDVVAKQFPVKAVTQVRSLEEAAAAIQNGYPVTVASMAGFGSMERRTHTGRDGKTAGYVKRAGQWAHQMAFIGVRWIDEAPWLRCMNSWGKCASGPDPMIGSQAISDSSWWVSPSDAASMLRDDSWAFGDVAGFPPQKINWQKAVSSW